MMNDFTKDLDGEVYMFFTCPCCDHVQYMPIDDLSFCSDVDVSVAVDGSVDAWIESTCMWCGSHLKKELSRRPDKE